MMTTEKIIENYKNICTDLEPVINLLPRDYQSINYLSELSKNGKISDDEILSAFRRANESDFLCGRKNNFRATILWITNPANIEKINNGNYDDREKQKSRKKKIRIQSHEYDFDEIEKKLHLANQKKLEQYEKTKDEKKESEWYEKHPNLRSCRK